MNKQLIIAKASGRRKRAVAQIELRKGTGNCLINDKPASFYFQNNALFLSCLEKPFITVDLKNEYDLKIKTFGGGIKSQSEAIQLALSKSLCLLDASNRSPLKLNGFLTRDSRSKERKKYGLKKSRKASQFSKR